MSSQHTTELVFDLQPRSPGEHKAANDKEWRTALGKRNRIAVGVPSCTPIESAGSNSILSEADLSAFPRRRNLFYLMDLAVTLLPDTGCRFTSADLIMTLESNSGGSIDALIWRLSPEEVVTRRVITVGAKDETGVEIGVSGVKVKAKLGESTDRKEEIERIDVQISSFGARTKEGGWRFLLTDSRDIAVSTSGLRALVVQPKGGATTARFRIVAQIAIQEFLDRWLTVLFRSDDQPFASLSYDLPKK